MPKGFSFLEVFETVVLIVLAIVFGETSPSVNKTQVSNAYYFYNYGVPVISYFLWFYIIIGYMCWGTYYQERQRCGKSWKFVVSLLSFCFLIWHPTIKSLESKVLKASKFRRYCITGYYATSYSRVRNI